MSVSYGGDSITFADGSVQSGGWTGMKNRIINGAMMIDQRNAGASVTPTTGTYTLDRYRAYQNVAGKFTVQQSSTAPAGFTNSTLITSTSAYTASGTDLFLFMQYIEGYNVADLGWGTANAQTVTLSFWVRSSLTGTFGGALVNGAENRNYPFTYTISSANTFEYKTITIAGDTSGTWLKTNGLGMEVNFGIGAGSTYSGTAGAWAAGAKFTATGATSVVGTSGATFYITGVQLERGSTASSFEYRPFGTELQLCQRYFETSFDYGTAPANGPNTTSLLTRFGMWAGMSNNNDDAGCITFKVTKRTGATIGSFGNSQGYWYSNGSWHVNAAAGFNSALNGSTVRQQVAGATVPTSGHWQASAEL